MTVGIAIIAHSQVLADGVAEVAGQMAHGEVIITAAGGTDSGDLGTSLEKTLRALEAADSGDGVLVLVDLGSAAMMTQTALEQLPDERRARIILSDAALVEGAVMAAIEASMGSDLAKVAATAKEATGMDKGV